MRVLKLEPKTYQLCVDLYDADLSKPRSKQTLKALEQFLEPGLRDLARLVVQDLAEVVHVRTEHHCDIRRDRRQVLVTVVATPLVAED